MYKSIQKPRFLMANENGQAIVWYNLILWACYFCFARVMNCAVIVQDAEFTSRFGDYNGFEICSSNTTTEDFTYVKMRPM